MGHRLKYARNATDGNGTLFRGDIYQVGIPDLLGGSTGHRIWESGTVKNYSLGARFVTADGRVFRYAKAAGELLSSQGCMCITKQIVANRSITVAAAATDIKVSLTITSNDGESGVIAEDELVGGYVVIFAANVVHRMIVGNAATTGAGTLVLTLDMPIGLALTGSHHAACMTSPYLDVKLCASEVTSVVGIPCVAASNGEYLWIQTWGMCWVAGQTDIGAAKMDRQLVFRHDGSLDRHDQSNTNNEFAQHAGFILQNAIAAETPTNPETFIMLQISI